MRRGTDRGRDIIINARLQANKVALVAAIAAAALALLAAAQFLPSGQAGAENGPLVEEGVFDAVDQGGELEFGPHGDTEPALSLAGVTLHGEILDEDGNFSIEPEDAVFPPIELPPVGFPTNLHIEVMSGQSITGQIDPDTGEATLNAELRFGLDLLQNDTVDCWTEDPVVIEATTNAPGGSPLDAGTMQMVLVDTEFAVPELPPDGFCSTPDLREDQGFPSPDENSITFELLVSQPGPPTPTPAPGSFDHVYVETSATSTGGKEPPGDVRGFFERQVCREVANNATFNIDVMVDFVHPDDMLGSYGIGFVWDGDLLSFQSAQLEGPDVMIQQGFAPGVPSHPDARLLTVVSLEVPRPWGVGVLARLTMQAHAANTGFSLLEFSDDATTDIALGFTGVQEPFQQEDLSNWPDGYYPGVLAVGVECNDATVTVNKVFTDDSDETVEITLDCTSGVIAPKPTIDASGTQPAVFTVAGWEPGATCTATEDAPGYISDATECEDLVLDTETPAECTITNEPQVATVTVTKEFADLNDELSAGIALECTSGEVDPDEPQQLMHEEFAVFTVSAFEVGATCSAAEPDHAPGYTADTSDCENIALEEGASFECTVVNVPNEATLTVHKIFSDENDAGVNITLDCTGGTIDPDAPQQASHGDPVTWTVTAFDVSDTCTATEEDVPAGYITDESDCEDVALATDAALECDIVNRATATVEVHKLFDDENDKLTAGVLLICTGGVVSPSVAQTVPHGESAVFTVTGFGPADTCTPLETVIPGYEVDDSECQALPLTAGAALECTIHNLFIEFTVATVTVHKEFAGNGNGLVASIFLSCTSGFVLPAQVQQASEGNPAVFTVNGFEPGATCAAEEFSIPAGWIADDSDCQDIAVEHEGEYSCTVVNTAIEGELLVWGDADCNGSVAIGDALKTARHLLGLSVDQEEGCPEIGADVLVDGEPRTWGDVDCNGAVAIGDALKIARHLLGLSVDQEEGCPEIGDEVTVALVAKED